MLLSSFQKVLNVTSSWGGEQGGLFHDSQLIGHPGAPVGRPVTPGPISVMQKSGRDVSDQFFAAVLGM